MRGPPERRSPAAGRRDRASILITGKLDNPLISTPGAGLQPFRTPRAARQTPATAAKLAWQRFRLALNRDLQDGTSKTRQAREVAYVQFCSAFLSRPFPIARPT